MDAQANEIKNKVMCQINSFAIVYYFLDDRLFDLTTKRLLNFQLYRCFSHCNPNIVINMVAHPRR